MDELASGIDSDVLIDLLDDQEGSDLDEDDEEFDEPLTSPLQLLSSGPGSTTTSITSSPPNNDDFLQPFNLSGKPFTSIKRGRGRPRREGGKPIPRKSSGSKVRRARVPGLLRGGGPRRVRSIDKDYEPGANSNDEFPMLDPETGAFVFAERPVMDEMPYAPENWPGKVCAFCNLGERSQLGQGQFLRLNCPDGFVPQRRIVETPAPMVTTPERESGDKSPRGPVTCRRQKSFNKCRHPSLTSEYVDELTIIGYNEEPDVSQLFEPNGQFYVHRSCALWSYGVTRTENDALQNVGPVVLQSSSNKCSFCNHFGASLICKVEGCNKFYHFPCATASGAFQELSTLRLYCMNHIGQASMCESSICYTCKTSGDIANLMYCSSCGEHYHGICVGLAQLPGVRAGWQCRKCRICQVCRITGDESKLMTCEQCDKIYHASCQRPIVATIPKYGWKCRCCRVCGDCGSRTPGAGLSSRWHSHYTVCDSCYQQRNKGFCCPICKRAYRAHAHREMVQCTSCNKFVHGTCDPDAELLTYRDRKECHPEYEYVCLLCKSGNQMGRAITSKRNSIEDVESLPGMQDQFFDDAYDFDGSNDVAIRNMGLGKGKPYSASKIAKKRLGYATGNPPGRPKGWGKGAPGKVGFMKRQRLNEFGRKRGPKAKMRGVFGVPGVGLQRPISDGKNDDEPGGENRLVLCSARDKFILTQDICVMCGALGTDQEGCLIGCVQCGQCYHPYCVNVKITKVILQKGWRCLDCTVCEGCGERNDEPRLILCDDCDISYHIYCMDPPLEHVPQGTWKCKWCAVCQSCGTTDPGFNCSWMNSYTECGPCASHSVCAGCSEPYNEGELIIQCVQCERWLHGACDSLKSEDDAEKCAEDGYNCILCRPRDVPPPHLVPLAAAKPPTPSKSPEVKSSSNYFLDGIYLSDTGHHMIKSLIAEHHATRKKRKKINTSVQDKEAGIMATIESVVAGGSMADNRLDGTAKIEMMDVKDEPMQEAYKEGMLWTKEDGPPPEGFTIFTMENGVCVLRRKRQRNLQKMGIGGFLVKVRGTRNGQDNDDVDILPGQTPGIEINPSMSMDGDKPRRKPIRRKPKSKLSEMFPPYLQEAFFGKELLDNTKELASSSSDEEKTDIEKSIQLTQDEMKAVSLTHKKEMKLAEPKPAAKKMEPLILKEEDDSSELKNVLNLPGDFLDNDLVKMINEDDDNLEKADVKDTKDELSDILGSHFNLDAISNINSKDVEDIFKGVLTDESQESQESNTFPMQTSNIYDNPSQPMMQQQAVPQQAIRPNTLPNVQNNLNSPLNFPSHSPYHSEYSNSPQFSPAFGENTNSWVSSVSDSSGDMDQVTPSGISTYNQRSSEKMKADESLGSGATISAVLYANMNHPEWKIEFPNWNDRYKQMIKKWRTLTTEQKAPYLQQARDNRSVIRIKKQQQSQIAKDTSEAPSMPKVSTPTPAVVTPLAPQNQPATLLVPNEDQDKMTSQHKSAREAEQERQWKQLQAMRQQQAQQQQHVIHEQRVQAINRAQRPPDQNFMSDLQPKIPQELSVTSPSAFPKSPSFPANRIAPMTPSHEASDPYAQPPGTPKPHFQANEMFEQQPRPIQFSVPNRATLPPKTFQRAEGASAEVNNHLRDLLQRQSERPFKKLDDHLLAGKGQQRLWPPAEEGSEHIVTSEATFRQPLPPPGVPRPRTLLGLSQIPRQGTTLVNLRMQPMQAIDTRMRLLMQQQQIKQRLQLVTSTGQLQQQFQTGVTDSPVLRFNPPQAPPTEQYDHLIPTSTAQTKIENVRDQQPNPPSNPVTANPQPNDQEIPDNVTAEIEKLERESGTMVELQVVGDILGGLGDDDDELLAEMGADFNILEYADPELEALAGEKTNILDLELEEEPMKREREKMARAPQSQAQPPLRKESAPPPLVSTAPPPAPTASHPPQEVSNAHPPLLALPQSNREVTAIHPQNAAPLIQQIHLQMLQQVQQAAAQNRPMAPGSRLQTPDGVTGIVTANNSVQLHVPPTYQRILMSQLQSQKLQMRARQIGPGPRMVNPTPEHQVNLQSHVPMNPPGPRLAAPPPPPYPGPPPPPYPGSGASPSSQQEQPLLLEDLLEQEKREQEKQNQIQTPQENLPTISNPESLLSDHDFERLKADVFNSGSIGINQNPVGQQWQNQPSTVPQPSVPEVPQVQLFNINLLPAPPLPPENIVTEQDRHAQMVYEQWLNQQNNILTQQLRYYETEVQKLRKSRKSLNSKQRQLKKSGSQLTETDANELQRIATEQSVLQKHLESSRKQTRQHNMLMQEYRNKQAKNAAQSPHMMTQSGQSPLGPPSSSPIHHAASQSPMMSPSGASPITQHGSPMHSPGQLINNSPGPGSVNFIQSPGNSMSPMQPSPRIGTPHSQNDSPVHSPQMCLPPPAPRMTSPQHRKIVTSPVAYTTDLRPGTPQLRYARSELPMAIQHRVVNRLPSPMQQKPRTPSPLNSPPPQQQLNITHQLLQKQLHQQVLLQQQQNSDQPSGNALAQFQRAAQLMRQRSLVNQVGQQTLTPQQHQLLLQQQQQLKQQQMAQMQSQVRMNQQQNIQSPKSPMPPKSPLVQQIMSPHSMPPSPMPPRSPMIYGNNPNSPMAKSPGYHQGMQTPNSPMNHPQQSPKSPMINPLQSPMSIRRPPSSPAPDRPMSVENPGTPRSYMDSGGGGHSNALPIPEELKHIRYLKLGLRGGSPMWNLGRGAKRVPTPPSNDQTKSKKDLYINKVSILKRKTHSPTVEKSGSLVSLDYNDLDDSSCTPPVTPPPTSSTRKMSGKRLPDQQDVIVLSNASEDIIDYDDDNNTVLSTEVSLNSAAQNDEDVMETLSQSDLTDVISSPLESVQIADEYLLFHENEMVDLASEEQYSDKEVEEYGGDNMHIVIRSPTTSDDELLMQEKNKKYMSSDQLLLMTDIAEPEEHEEETAVEEPEISPTRSEEQISTKEDFEELIDEGSKKQKILKPTMIDFHKYVTSAYSGTQMIQVIGKASGTTKTIPLKQQLPHKLSLITTPVIHANLSKEDGAKLVQNHNVLKLGGSVSPVITIVSASSSQMGSIIPTGFTVPVISASTVRQLSNVKVINKPSTSLSVSHDLPKKIFKDESSSPDEEDKKDEEKPKESPKARRLSVEPTREPSPIITKTSSPVIIHNTPELKMTAQIVQDSQSNLHVGRLDDGYEMPEESKSVVISIPSPTPSQEQMLDNMTLQVLENRRREGKGIPSEFESFEEVLDMIENFTGETPTVLEDSLKDKHKEEKKEPEIKEVKKEPPKQPNLPQLSPLSQPNDLTTNMANASQQLRNLLSLHTTASSSSATEVKSTVQSPTTVVTTRIIQTSGSVIVPNFKQTTMATLISNGKSTPAILQLTSAVPKTTQEMPVPPLSAPSKSEPSKSLSLTAMLQSHPAASPSTISSADTITAASLLTSSVSLSKEHFNPSLVQAQPNLNLLSSVPTSKSVPSTAPPLVSTVNKSITSSFLHTQLTKVIKKTEVKQEIKEEKEDFFDIKQEIGKNIIMPRNEDSQNVLLKKLLQNTGCASTQSVFITTSPSITTTTHETSTPTLSSLLPSLVKTEPNQDKIQPKTVMSRETSFVSSPVVTSQLHIDVKKNLPPSRTPSRDDLLSPQTPKSTCSQDSLQTPPLIIKKELIPQSPIHTEIKKEFMDETSQHSEISDHSRSEMKEEMEMDTDKNAHDQKEEIKKQKRRLYQQKRRLTQNLNKENLTGQPKKRPRKSSKVEEDYDTYIDGVLAQLRNLPSMNVQEPFLNKNFGVVSIYGSGDLSKLFNKDYDSRYGDLEGTYGNAVLPDYLDYYSTKPFGDMEPLPEKPQPSTQRGFYDKEFPPIKFDNEETKRFDLFSREDSPDSIVSSSSPECVKEPYDKFMGLRLIDEDADEEIDTKGRLSPVIPIIVPKPIRLKASPIKKDPEMDKENISVREICTKPSKFNSPPSAPLKDSGNVTVTLTLTSSAAENIMGVLRDLANILQIPAPTSYQIVKRTSTPPSQKLGMYRTKGKDGREGAPIDIQSILNGAAKFCKHCDVVILNNMIKKKVSELPFLFKDSELLVDGDDLYFCSTTCYTQFALMHRSPSISEEKVAAIVDHLCQKDKMELKADPKLRTSAVPFAMFNKPYDSLKSETYQPQKTWKGVRYKIYTPGCVQPATKYKKLTDKETMELLYKMGVTVVPPKGTEDTRKCMLCHNIGDGVADGPGRLLNFDVDKWVHLNCGLWSEGVYETVNGALMNLENALRQSMNAVCVHCHNSGATVRCFKTRCTSVYHLNCAVKDNCVFYKNKTTFCSAHIPKNEKDNELTTLSVSRRVYINRDENRQVAAVMHHSDTNNLLRVGSLIFLNVGQILPHQLQSFHTQNYIYPIGYKIVRFYWSIRRLNKRCKYVCEITEYLGRPKFSVTIHDPPDEDIEFVDSTPRTIWLKIVEELANLRKEHQCVKTFPRYVNGEDFFGLNEPAVVRVLESLPGIETTDYKFKYGRNPLLELPLAINPTGAARTEPRLKNQQHWKRHHTQRSAVSSIRPVFAPTPPGPSISSFSEVACPYSKQFVHTKSSQYKKMKMDWRNNVYLARSKIQGLGLYAAKDLEKHTMVIEYIGEIIRTELAETREKKYEARNRGIYMFRLDEERVIDATLSGGLARYINHSCNPNCVAETVEVDRDLKIIIFAKRRLQRGEELSYDYKFDIEDDQHKISCMCGAPNCRKWMN